ncbi:hypothetical protein GCM10007383_17040 [Arenibacter certesii]|uniref:Uncharacterized protein n=2 Tax=Arenibacter certesii TaxID=228955 RepID=A0A918MJP1_9FLAO|nr:hypothetical protein GCM10007383_17040 [Arenibacter certesii]
MDMVNFSQLNEFFSHAQFHKQKYGDNLIDFVSKHYGAQKEQHHREHQEEHKDHESLPFNHQSCIHAVTAFVLNEAPAILLKTPPAFDSTSGYFYQESYEQISNTDIFQPPKHA